MVMYLEPLWLAVMIDLAILGLGFFLGSCDCQRWYDLGHDDGANRRGVRSVHGWM